MNSMPNPTATDANDDLVTRADERLAHAYEQIARADDQLARVTDHLSKLEQGAARKRSSRSRPARRGLAGLLLAACIFLAAFIWHSSGDAARPVVDRWIPQLALASLPPPKTPEPSEQANSSAPRLAAAQPVSPTASAQTAPQDVAPMPAPLSPELAQTLQTMTRDLANLERGLEELKMRQEQLASDNARAIEQLRASQDQIVRDNAKAAEQLKAMASFTARAKQGVQPATAAAPLRTSATATRQPAPTRQPPQTRAQP